MRITFTSEPEEAYRGHLAIGEIANKGHVFGWLTTIPLVLVMWFLMAVFPERWIAGTVIAFVFAVMFLVSLMIDARRRLKRITLTDPNSTLTFQVDVDDTGVSVAYEHTHIQAGWGAIRRVVETKEFYFLMTAFAAAQHIPKRAIPGGAGGEVDRELRALIRQRSPDRGANLLPDKA